MRAIAVPPKQQALPSLFRRREIWLPTWWGWLLLLVALVIAAIGFALGAYGFLAQNGSAPARDGRAARVLVVEGWIDDHELDQAVAMYRRGRYERIVTTGGPIQAWSGGPSPWPNFAERAARYLAAHGLADAPITAVAAPLSTQERTYVSALALREWARGSGVTLETIDLVSSGVHTRRSRKLFRMALGDSVEVGALATLSDRYDAQRWWTSSVGAKTVLGETISLAWTDCCFWPAR